MSADIAIAALPAAAAHTAAAGHAAVPAGGHPAPPMRLPEAMRQTGVNLAQFEAAVQAMGAAFVPSASAGKPLLRLNDHAGVLVVAAHEPSYGVTIAERLAVLAEAPPGAAEVLYFVKGYGDRLVSVQAVAEAVAHLRNQRSYENAAPGAAAGGAPVQMETALRTALLRLSEQAVLHARRHIRESRRMVMSLPPNPTPLPAGGESWANLKYMIPTPIGHAGPRTLRFDGTTSIPKLRIDYNGIENRALLFLDSAARLGLQELPQTHNASGPVLAEIHGIRSWEVMGPAGVEHGVKGARMQQLLGMGGQAGHDTVLRLTTEDELVHEITFSASSVRMRMLAPNEPSALSGPHQQAEIDVYSHRGVNIGPNTSSDGFPDPALALSTGEQLLLGPLLMDRSGRASALCQALAGTLRTALTLDSQLGSVKGLVSGGVNTVIKAAALASTVWGLNHLLRSVSSTQGVLGLQAQVFSGAGAGPVDSKMLALAVGLMVVSQHLFTLARNAVLKALPQTWTGRDMHESVRMIAMPAVEETARLLLNYGVQTQLGLPRGSAADPGMLAVQGLVFALVHWMAERQGAGSAPQHHPVAATAFAVAGGTVDITLRAAGNALDARAPMTAALYSEAAVSRAITRGYDKTLVPVVAMLLAQVSNGMTRAGAVLEHQVHSENQYNNPVSSLKTRLDAFLAHGDEAVLRLEDKQCLAVFSHLVEVSQRVMRMGLQRSGVQRLAAASVREVALATIDEEAPAQANTSAASSVPQARFADDVRAFDRIVNEGVHVPNELNQLSDGSQQRARARKMAALRLGAAPIRTALTLQVVDAEGKAAAVLRGSTGMIPTADSTFTLHGQAQAWQAHQHMTTRPGFSSAGLSPEVERRCKRELVRYTEESQFFHYPLRWGQTGQVTLQPVVPGIDFPYRTLNRPNNVGGEAEARFDPIQALYVNLGCMRSERYAALMHRAVVTEARYLANRLPAGAEVPNDAVHVGQHVGLTEIFSVTQSPAMAAAFGQALSHGAADRSRSQRLLVLQETGVNVSRYTDLVQAEAILMPGALFRVETVRPGVRDDQDPIEEIGQVVCLRQVDTVQALLRLDNPGALDDVRNYFLGRPMHPAYEPNDPDAQRLLNPYTSAGAPRSTKDAIHAAILRDDAIVPHLDEAIRNIHHEHFLRKNLLHPDQAVRLLVGAHLEARSRDTAQSKEQAQQLSTRLGRLAPTAAVSELDAQHGHQLLAWLLTSLLRQPIQMHTVRATDTGELVLSERSQLFNSTYDKVLLAGQTPLVLGYGADDADSGSYACTMSDGESPSLMRSHAPADPAAQADTVQGLLHAFVFSAWPERFDYISSSGHGLVAGPEAQRTVHALWAKLQAFVATDYIVLQQALRDAPWVPAEPAA